MRGVGHVGNEVLQGVNQCVGQHRSVSPRAIHESGMLRRRKFFKRCFKTIPNCNKWHAKYLWRRYDHHAHKILDLIANDPTLAQPAYDDHPYYKAELLYIVKHENVKALADLFRRRTPLQLIAGTKKLSDNSFTEELIKLLPQSSKDHLNKFKEECNIGP